jgi:rRNA large subunit m3Psi methyltransferase RlmH
MKEIKKINFSHSVFNLKYQPNSKNLAVGIYSGGIQIFNEEYEKILYESLTEDSKTRDPYKRFIQDKLELVYLNKKMVSGLQHLVFIIGGPYGFSDEIYKRSNEKIALSKMTLSHQMIRLFFTEQVYRAFTILKGEPYHHD